MAKKNAKKEATAVDDAVVYVDNEGREYDAQILRLGAELAVRGGDNGDWTVINVPRLNPNAPIEGAHWKLAGEENPNG